MDESKLKEQIEEILSPYESRGDSVKVTWDISGFEPVTTKLLSLLKSAVKDELEELSQDIEFRKKIVSPHSQGNIMKWELDMITRNINDRIKTLLEEGGNGPYEAEIYKSHTTNETHPKGSRETRRRKDNK